MKIDIATTTGFHLRRLAVELARLGEDVEYRSYVPRFRTRREGLDDDWTRSHFLRLMPTSALALATGNRWQSRAVENMLLRTDISVSRSLREMDVFVGLSSMAVRSAERARQLGGRVVIERGSRHVLSQTELVSQAGGPRPSEFYIKRELDSYAAADFITVPSKHAANSFEEFGFAREKVFTCPLGVDLEMFRPTTRPQGSTKLLFVGGWSYRKGVDLLMQSLPKRPGMTLTHVGSEAGVPIPRDNSQIQSVGHLGHEQLAKIMAQHHILVLPSREDGFGMVLMEALASGLPVVASNMTGGPDIREKIDNPEWVETFDSGDEQDLLRALDVMAEREQDDNRSGVRARLTDRDRSFFSWRGYGERYGLFLRSITASPGTQTHAE